MNIRMKRYNFIFFALCLSLSLAHSLFSACSKEADEIAPDQAEWTLKVSLSDMQNGASAPTKISYSGTFGEHSEFETGDSFGHFVLDEKNEIKHTNLKVYCS